MNLTALCLTIAVTLNVVRNGAARAFRVRRLVGGTKAVESEFPYQVSLRYYGVHICSGALISDRHVLSAAHCVCGLMDEPAEELSVATGSIDYRGGEDHVVEGVKCHPDYVFGPEESWVDDLMIVTLAEPVRTSPYQSPIAFATSDTPVGERAVISGWGRIRTFSFLSRSLQKLSLPIIDNKACQEYYSNTTILSSQICTLERKGVGACKGDSGSPLVYNNTLIGIFSWTRPCAIGFPDVFTRVSNFTDFIEEAMQDGR